MNNPEIPSLWGVKGLNEAEQRAVRGGSIPGGRADCIRSAINNYAASRRNNPTQRASQLAFLRQQIASCASSNNS